MVDSGVSSSVRKKPGSTSIVRIPNGATSGASDSIQPSTPNFDAAYAVTNSPPTRPAVEEIVTTSPDRCARITGRAARVTLTGPNRVVSICARNSSGLISSKNPALKLPALLTSTSIRPNRSTATWTAASASAGSVTSSLTTRRSSCCAERRGDLLGVAAGGDDRVTGGQGGLGDVDAQAAAGAGDEPNLLVTHVCCTPSLDLRVLSGRTASSGVALPPNHAAGRAWETLMMGLLTGTLSRIQPLVGWTAWQVGAAIVTPATASRARPAAAFAGRSRRF